ncbi:MAG: sugar phosphate nucleotidyltransferase [Phycisphaerae bacterium]
MRVTKAVITAASRGQRSLPLHTLVDRDGQEKTALRLLLEEALAAGIEGIAVIHAPGDAEAYTKAAGDLAGRMTLLEQTQALGYGQALLCARDFVAGESFLHLVGDHVWLSGTTQRCAAQLVARAQELRCSVSAVQATRETMLPYYGVVGGRRVAQTEDLYEVEELIEKPTPTQAEQQLLIPGLRAGHYLCFFGMHVLTPAVMDILARLVATGTRVPLAAALRELIGRERYVALQMRGTRYDLGTRYGLLQTQLALALAGENRDEVLAMLVEQLALRQQGLGN